MAAAYASQGHRTLLIDADLRRPSQRGLFDLGPHPGLTDAIVNNASVPTVCQRVVGNELLSVIAAGTQTVHNYHEVGKKVREILAESRNQYDMVFIDAPPMLYFAEPLDLASLVDGVLLVTRAGQTSREAVSAVLTTTRWA
jgi:Mrp family chromosome partitioning ATPase